MMHHNLERRLVTVIAHVDHGKSTLMNILKSAVAATSSLTDINTSLICNPTEFTLAFNHNISTGTSSGCKLEHLSVTSKVLILQTTPGNVDFHPDSFDFVLSDGAIIVLDCIEGRAHQTHILLRKSLLLRLKPVLFINKMDRVFLELQLTGEEIYKLMARHIEQVNNTIELFKWSNDVDWQVSPTNGTVVFGSALHQWGFTLKSFARYYATKFNTSEEKVSEKLWGEWVFVTLDGKSKWIHCDKMVNGVDRDTNTKRSFVSFVIDPIIAMCKAVMDNELNKKGELKAFNMAKAVGVILSVEVKTKLRGKALLNHILQKWLPLTDTILDMIVLHLPSPLTAQKYRCEALYSGPQSDDIAQAIMSCDSGESAPVTMYVSKMIPQTNNTFIAHGRVFSGRVRAGQKMFIASPPSCSATSSMAETIEIESVLVIVNGQAETVEEVSAGQLCGVVGINNQHLKSYTISSSQITGCLCRGPRVSTPFVMTAEIRTRDPADALKLTEMLEKVSSPHLDIHIETDEAADRHFLCGHSESHLDTAWTALMHGPLNGLEVYLSSPAVRYYETVSSESGPVMSKTANKHVRLTGTVSPVSEDIMSLFDSHALTSSMDARERMKILKGHPAFGVGFDGASGKIWSCGDDDERRTGSDSNVLVDDTRGVSFLNEVRDSIVFGFQTACMRGPLCGEPLRGVKMVVNDVGMNCDPIRRGAGQVVPAARRVVHGAMLNATPILMEPVYLILVVCAREQANVVREMLTSRRQGSLIDCDDKNRLFHTLIRAHVPVAHSFGLYENIQSVTHVTADYKVIFSHFQKIEGDFRDTASRLGGLVREIRKKKGLTDILPSTGEYLYNM